MKLFNYQTAAVHNILNSFKKTNHVCLSYYTGAGKTNIMIDLCRLILSENPSAKIGVSSYLTTEIRRQTYARALANGLGDCSVQVSVGIDIIKNKSVYIFNPQSVYKLANKIKFDYLFIDECHAGLSEGTIMIRSIINHSCSKNSKILLLSATPWDVLALDEFKDAVVLKRSLDVGVKIDRRVADVNLHFEKAKIKFTPDDFGKDGDLKKITSLDMAVIKSTCIGQMKYLIDKYGSRLGEKVVVICPPGNLGEIAREMSEIFGGRYLLSMDTGRGNVSTRKYNEIILDEFQKDTTFRFLFVVHKCQVGFDMENLDSIIDLTMTRNITNLVQRIGRVARRYENKEKKYFYVYDESLNDRKLEWLVGTLVDFSIGNYDGWTTRTAKYRPIKGHGLKLKENSIRISEIISALQSPKNMESTHTITYAEYKRPTYRTLYVAIEEAKKYESRYDLLKQNPSLYKWFRTKGFMKELAEIHPLTNPRKWNEITVWKAIKKCKSRNELKKNYPGAYDWIYVNNRSDLLDKAGYPNKTDRINSVERCQDILEGLNRWNDFRKYAGARKWATNNGKLQELKRWFYESKGKSLPQRKGV